MRTNLPSCKILAEVGERPHEPLIDLVQCELVLRRLENCLQMSKNHQYIIITYIISGPCVDDQVTEMK